MRMMFAATLGAASVVLLASCSDTDTQGPVATGDAADQTPMLWLAANPNSTNWQSYVETAIDTYGSALMTATPGDIGDWCPSFADQSPAERKAFWSFLMSSLMKYESNYDPAVTYTEPFNDAQGNRVVSRGVLQLSKESANGYRCGIDDPQELHDPQTNLTCAVRIMNRWVERDAVIQDRTLTRQWRGLARYWSPFRRSQQRSVMQDQVSASSYCKA